MENKNNNEICELQGRFTVWLEKLAERTRINYIEELKRTSNFKSLDEVDERVLVWTKTENPYEKLQEEFGFENEELEVAFNKLPRQQKRILFMFFIEGKTVEEITVELNNKRANICQQKRLGISKLRRILMYRRAINGKC